MKIKPKDTAIKEIKRRVVTLDKAKIDFNKWINEGLLRGGFSDDVIQYWVEVKNEVDKINNDIFIMEEFEKMCNESLSPKGMDYFDKVKEHLILARPHLK